MRHLKWCPDGSASTSWNYAGLLCNLYRDDGQKRYHHSKTSRAQSPLNPSHTWCNMLLTGLHHSPVVIISLLLPSNFSILPLQLILQRFLCTYTRYIRKTFHRYSYNVTAQCKYSRSVSWMYVGHLLYYNITHA